MNTDNKAEKLGTQKIPKLVIGFSFTTFAALVFNSLYTLTDALFVSRGVGDNAMGGVSVVFPFVILQGAIASAVGSGAASIISRLLGQNERKKAGETALNAMAVFYISAIIITILGFIFMNPILRAMGVTDELYPLARDYFIIILAGNVFSTGFSSIIRAEGKMIYALLIWVIPISVNIALDALFILVFKWGVIGSAAATVICQFTSFIMSVVFFAKFSVLKFKGAKLHIKSAGEILAIGLPSLVQMGSVSVLSAIVNKTLSSVAGTAGVNAFAYISKIMTFGIVPFTAVSQSLSPIVGYNFGAGKNDRVKKAVSFCFLISFVYSVFAVLVTELFPKIFIEIFTSDAALVSYAADGLKIVVLSLLFMFTPMLFGAFFQALGKKSGAFIMYSAKLIFMVPALLIASRNDEISAVWKAYTFSSVVSSVFAAVFYLFVKKRSVEKTTQVC